MRLLSPRELATALGVSESSLKRWVDAGRIVAARTEGGHRKIALSEAVRFIRESGAPVARPELLDMPEVTRARTRDDGLFSSLIGGDASGTRDWLLARYLGGTSLAALCDGPVKDAMYRIGELWRHDADGIVIEHRATDTCLQALAHMRNMLDVAGDAPLAIGASPEDDPYILPSFMAAIVVSEAGMRAINLGPDTPTSVMHQAVLRFQPRLVWISASAPLVPARARELTQWTASLPPSTLAIVGGRQGGTIGTAPPVRRADTMVELSAIAAGIVGESAGNPAGQPAASAASASRTPG